MVHYGSFDQYDIERMEEARELLLSVYEYNCGDSKMRKEIKRLETIIAKIDFLIDYAEAHIF